MQEVASAGLVGLWWIGQGGRNCCVDLMGGLCGVHKGGWGGHVGWDGVWWHGFWVSAVHAALFWLNDVSHFFEILR